MARGTAGGTMAELRRLARTWVDEFTRHGQRVGAIRTDLPPGLLSAILVALEEGIDLWLGKTIGAMSPAQIDATAATLTRLYQRIATPERSRKTQAARKTQTMKQSNKTKTMKTTKTMKAMKAMKAMKKGRSR
jgi:hypothetical protein